MDNIIKRRKFTNTIVLALGLLLFFNSQTVYGQTITMDESILRIHSGNENIVKFEISSNKTNYVVLKKGCNNTTCYYDFTLFEKGTYRVVVTTKSGKKFTGIIKK